MQQPDFDLDNSPLPAPSSLQPSATATARRRRDRKRAARACQNCKKSPYACNSARPCRRCVSSQKECVNAEPNPGPKAGQQRHEAVKCNDVPPDVMATRTSTPPTLRTARAQANDSKHSWSSAQATGCGTMPVATSSDRQLMLTTAFGVPTGVEFQCALLARDTSQPIRPQNAPELAMPRYIFCPQITVREGEGGKEEGDPGPPNVY